MEEFIGFHGTSEVIANRIKKVNFEPGEIGYLGSGVYFYIDNEFLAFNYAYYHRKHRPVIIIKNKFCIPTDNIINLCNPLNEENIILLEGIKDFVKKTLSSRKIDNKQLVIKHGNLIDFMCAKLGIVGVICNLSTGFKIYTKGHKKRTINYKPQIPNGLEFCLKDLSILELDKLDYISRMESDYYE